MPFEKEDLEPLQIRYSEILCKDVRIDCEIGWYDIIEETLYQLFTISDELKIVSIGSNRDGELSFSFREHCEDIATVLDNARNLSQACCEICGEIGKAIRKSSDKIAIRCDEHRMV